MEPLRVYLDTSVFGGYYDDEFSLLTALFFDAIFARAVIPLISDTLVAEMTAAPANVRELLQCVLPQCERLILTPETIRLQQVYPRANVVTPKYADDALHMAQATVARAQVLASWNFRHLVNPNKTRQFNGVNVIEGFDFLVIMTLMDISKLSEAGDETQSNES